LTPDAKRGEIMNGKQWAGTILGTIIKIAVVIVVVYYVYKAASIAYDYGYRIFAEGPVSEEPGFDVSITVTSDKDVKDIGEIMESRGLIRDANLFFLQELLSEYHGKLKPGVYTLNTSMTVEEMLEIMAAEEETASEGETADSQKKDEGNTEIQTETSTDSPETEGAEPEGLSGDSGEKDEAAA